MAKKQTMDHAQLLVLSLLAGEDMYGYQMIVELARRSDHTFEMKEGRSTRCSTVWSGTAWWRPISRRLPLAGCGSTIILPGREERRCGQRRRPGGRIRGQ